MDTYWIFFFTVHYFSISSIFLFITYMAKNIMIVTAFRKKFQFFYFISKPHFSNPFTTYMAFLSPNVTAILKFFKGFNSFP